MTAVLVMLVPPADVFWLKVRATMVWARLEVAFMLVAAMVRFFVPSAILWSISSYDPTGVSLKLST